MMVLIWIQYYSRAVRNKTDVDRETRTVAGGFAQATGTVETLADFSHGPVVLVCPQEYEIKIQGANFMFGLELRCESFDG